MFSRKTAAAAMAVSSLLLFTACKGAQERAMEQAIEEETGNDADVDVNGDGTMEITTDEGTFSTSQELPADWPTDVVLMEDAQITFSGSANPTTGKPGMMVMYTTEATAQEVFDHYKSELASSGWTITANAAMGESFVLGAEKDNRTLGVSIASGDGMTSVTIGMEEESD